MQIKNKVFLLLQPRFPKKRCKVREIILRIETQALAKYFKHSSDKLVMTALQL